MGRPAGEKKKREGEMEKSNYSTVTGPYSMQKNGSDGNSDEESGLELGKVGSFVFSMIMGFVPAYSVTDGLLNQKKMSLI